MTATDPNETFRQEARELLESLEQSLLDLDQNPEDRDLVDTAFRALHTLKGSGAMFGFDEVADFVHDFETAFDQVRKGKADIGPSSLALRSLQRTMSLSLLQSQVFMRLGVRRSLGN